MSRLVQLSPAAIKQLFNQEQEDQLILLLEINPVEVGVSSVYLADGFTQRLTGLYTDDEDVVYGVVHNSTNYIYIPMDITLPQEQDTGLSTCSVTFNYVTQEMIELIREHLKSPADVTLKLILSSAPNTKEAEFSGFFLNGATYSRDKVTLSLSTIPYTREPFPCYNFTPSLFPGIF